MKRFYLREKWKKRGVIGGILILLSAAYLYTVCMEQRNETIHKSQRAELSEDSGEILNSPEESELKIIAVHVSGAVKYPDQVYYLTEGVRLEAAIQAAGGIIEEADLTKVNLAAVIKDGQKIRIPFQGERMKEEEEGAEENPETLLTNINLATKIELINLPGIGETYAQRILEYRDQQGNFQRIEDIMKVKGIGEKIFADIKELITVG